MFLDAVIAHRRALGLAGVSMAWGLWDEADSNISGTMRQSDTDKFINRGMRPLSAADGMLLLDTARELDMATVTLMDMDFSVQHTDATTIPVVLRDQLTVARPRRRAALRPAAADAPARQLSALPAAEARAAVRDLVNDSLSESLGRVRGTTLPATTPLRDLGFDSLSAVELRNRLNAATGLRLSTTLVFDHPTVDAIIRHVEDMLGLADQPSDPRDQDDAEIRRLLTEIPIARLRRAGVVDMLLDLRDGADRAASGGPVDAADLATMDVESLVRLATRDITETL
ncbi:MAG: hypothetical protein HOQ24_01745 [Mycobacteriaceae bacterium]|nr:hypothetical protein [Mycobacteriaceae bacterium]